MNDTVEEPANFWRVGVNVRCTLLITVTSNCHGLKMASLLEKATVRDASV